MLLPVDNLHGGMRFGNFRDFIRRAEAGRQGKPSALKLLFQEHDEVVDAVGVNKCPTRRDIRPHSWADEGGGQRRGTIPVQLLYETIYIPYINHI